MAYGEQKIKLPPGASLIEEDEVKLPEGATLISDDASKKKVSTVSFGKTYSSPELDSETPSTGKIPTVVDYGDGEPLPNNIVDLSRKATEYSKKTKEIERTDMRGNPIPETIPDESFIGTSKKIIEDLDKQGIKKDFVDAVSELPDEAFNDPNTSKDKLVELYKTNRIKFHQFVNEQKNRIAIKRGAFENQKNANNGIDDIDPNQMAIHVANKYLGTYEEAHPQNLNQLQNIISKKQDIIEHSLIGEERTKALDRVRESYSSYINPTNPDIQAEYEQSPLKNKVDITQYSALKTLQLFDAKKYEQAVNILNTDIQKQYTFKPEFENFQSPVAASPSVTTSDSTLAAKNKGSLSSETIDQQIGKESVLRQLTELGRNNLVTQINSQQYDLEQAFNNTDNAEEKEAIKQQYVLNQGKLAEVSKNASQDKIKFPLTSKLEFDNQVKELVQDAGMGAVEYGTNKFAHGVGIGGESFEDMAVSIFGSEKDKALLGMKRIGESKWFESKTYLPEDYRSTGSPFIMQPSPVLKDAAKEIMGGKKLSDLSADQKQKLTELVANNQSQIETVTNPKAGKSKNFFSKATLYSNTGFIGEVGAFMYKIMGAKSLGLSGKSAELLTLYNDGYSASYTEKLKEGASAEEANQYGVLHGGVMLLAGTVSSKFDAVKDMLAASKSPISKQILGLGEAGWDAIVNKNKSTISKIANGVSDVVKSNAKMIGTYGVGVSIASDLADKGFFNKDISVSEMADNVKHSAIDMARGSVGLAGIGFISHAIKNPVTLKDKATIWEIGDNKEFSKQRIDEAVAKNELTQAEGDAKKKVIDNVASLIDKVPTENSKGKLLTDNEKVKLLYNLILKEKGKEAAKDLPDNQSDKAEHIALVADYANGIILENPTDKQLESRKNTLEKQIEGKDENGKPLLPEKELLKAKAQLEAVNNAIEHKQSFDQSVKLEKRDFRKPQGNPEEISQPIELKVEPTVKEEAPTVSDKGVGEVKLDKPSAEQQLKDIKEGNMVTFEYKNESEVPEVFKDKISSKGETNGKPYVKVTMAKSLADYHLQSLSTTKSEPTVKEEAPTVSDVSGKVDETHLMVSSDAKTALADGRKKQEVVADENGNPIVKETEFTKDDADLELDRLEALAKKGKLTPEEFQKSYFGQSTGTVTFKAASEQIKNDAVGFVEKLRNSFEGEAEPQPTNEAKAKASTVSDVVDFNLNDIRNPRGKIGEQGFTEEGARDLLTYLGIDVKGMGLKEMVEHLKSNPNDLQKLLDFTKKNPIELQKLPDGSYDLKDGNHRANLLYYAGIETVPSKITDVSNSKAETKPYDGTLTGKSPQTQPTNEAKANEVQQQAEVKEPTITEPNKVGEEAETATEEQVKKLITDAAINKKGERAKQLAMEEEAAKHGELGQKVLGDMNGGKEPPVEPKEVANDGSEDWAAVRKEKLKEINGVKEMMEKRKPKGWTQTFQSAAENVQKMFPKKSLYEAMKARVKQLKLKLESGELYNPTSEDNAVFTMLRAETNKRISEVEGQDSSNPVERLAANIELENLHNDLMDIARVTNPEGEAGRAFNILQSEAKFDENNGLKIRRMELMKAKGGEPLTPEENKWAESQWEKEKEIMRQEQEAKVKGMQEDFDAKIAELQKEYEDKLKETGKGKSATTKDKTLSQKGKDIADQIRKLKIQKGDTAVDVTMGLRNLAIEAVATLVEKGATIAEAIKKVLEDDKYKGLTGDELTNHIIDGLKNKKDKTEELSKIEKFAEENDVTDITKDMVEKNLIRDYVNSHIGDVDKKEVFDVAYKDLKKILPNITKERLREAYLKDGEFKQPTKKALENGIKQQETELRRIAREERNPDQQQKVKLAAEKENAIKKKKEYERKLADGKFEEAEPIKLKKKDAELIRLEKEKSIIEEAYRKKQKEFQEKNKHWAERAMDTIRSSYVALLIGSPVTLAKVGFMSLVRPLSEGIRKATLGKVFDSFFPNISKAALRGGESSSISSIKKGYEAYFRNIGEAKLEEKYQKAENELRVAAKEYNDYKNSSNPDAKKLEQLKNKMNDKLIKSTGSFIYKFIGSSSIKDAWTALVNRSNEIEKQFGKVESESFKDGNWLDKSNYVAGFIGRSHSAAKTFSGRFSFAAGFMARLEGAVKNGEDITKGDKILEIAHESYLDWERGKYQQSNAISDIWNKITNSISKGEEKGIRTTTAKAMEALLKGDVAITRVPVNILHESVVEYTFGAIKAAYMGGKEYLKARKDVKESGIMPNEVEFKDALRQRISQMDEKQAATIVRCFTKGGLGIGLYALALISGGVQFGILPHLGQKKKKDEKDLKKGEMNPGDIIIGDTRMNHTFAKLVEHVPALYPTAMGLGMAQAYKDEIDKGKTTKEAVAKSLFTHLQIIEGSVPQTQILSPSRVSKKMYDIGEKRLEEMGVVNTDEKSIFTKDEQENATIKTLKERGIELKQPSQSHHKIDVDEKHPNGLMMPDEWDKFQKIRKDVILKGLPKSNGHDAVEGLDDIMKAHYKVVEKSKWGIVKSKIVQGKDLTDEQLKSKVQSLQEKATEYANDKLGLKKKKDTTTTIKKIR